MQLGVTPGMEYLEVAPPILAQREVHQPSKELQDRRHHNQQPVVIPGKGPLGLAQHNQGLYLIHGLKGPLRLGQPNRRLHFIHGWFPHPSLGQMSKLLTPTVELQPNQRL